MRQQSCSPVHRYIGISNVQHHTAHAHINGRREHEFVEFLFDEYVFLFCVFCSFRLFGFLGAVRFDCVWRMTALTAREVFVMILQISKRELSLKWHFSILYLDSCRILPASSIIYFWYCAEDISSCDYLLLAPFCNAHRKQRNNERTSYVFFLCFWKFFFRRKH